MAKRSTPKKRQAKSSTSRRYKAYQQKSQKKLMSMVDFMKTLEKKGGLKIEKKTGKQVTKIKA